MIPCYYGKQCGSIDTCPFLHWVGEIKTSGKKKKSKKGKLKRKKICIMCHSIPFTFSLSKFGASSIIEMNIERSCGVISLYHVAASIVQKNFCHIYIQFNHKTYSL